MRPIFPRFTRACRDSRKSAGVSRCCRIALERSAIAPDNVIECAAVERNVFVNSVALQNRGYAYMPIA